MLDLLGACFGSVDLVMKTKWQHIWAFSVGRGLDAKGCRYSVRGFMLYRSFKEAQIFGIRFCSLWGCIFRGEDI